MNRLSGSLRWGDEARGAVADPVQNTVAKCPFTPSITVTGTDTLRRRRSKKEGRGEPLQGGLSCGSPALVLRESGQLQDTRT